MKISDRIRQRTESEFRGGLDISPEEYALIDLEIDALLEMIRTKSSAYDARSELDELAALQELLAILVFKYRVTLSLRQRAIVQQFDRSDDPDVRTHIFLGIRNGLFAKSSSS